MAMIDLPAPMGYRHGISRIPTKLYRKYNHEATRTKHGQRGLCEVFKKFLDLDVVISSIIASIQILLCNVRKMYSDPAEVCGIMLVGRHHLSVAEEKVILQTVWHRQ